MKVELAGHVTMFGKMPGGSLFRSAAPNVESLAIKIRSGDSEARLLMRHPNWSGRPGISPTIPDSALPVFEYTGARFRPSLAHLQPSADGNYEIGDVVLVEDRIYLLAGLREGTVCVDIDTGEVVDLRIPPFGFIRRWSIVEIVDGQAVTPPIFEWPVWKPPA